MTIKKKKKKMMMMTTTTMMMMMNLWRHQNPQYILFNVFKNVDWRKWVNFEK